MADEVQSNETPIAMPVPDSGRGETPTGIHTSSTLPPEAEKPVASAPEPVLHPSESAEAKIVSNGGNETNPAEGGAAGSPVLGPEKASPAPIIAAPASAAGPAKFAENSNIQATTPPLKELLVKANAARHGKRAEKLERIMLEAKKKGGITNDEAQRILRVSHATAFRYLKALVASGRLRPSARSGRLVRYEVL